MVNNYLQACNDVITYINVTQRHKVACVNIIAVIFNRFHNSYSCCFMTFNIVFVFSFILCMNLFLRYNLTDYSLIYQ